MSLRKQDELRSFFSRITPQWVKKYRAIYKERGFKALVKEAGWKVVLGVILYYLIRDLTLYVLIPYLIYKGVF